MKKYAALVILLLLIVNIAQASDLKKIVSLRGTWKFNVGDSEKYFKTNFDDQKWETIEVPSSWEDEGFPGYDGICWYRYKIDKEIVLPRENLVLNLGYIDDVDEVYFNGKLIGTRGKFPPEYVTAYNTLRIYNIPPELIRRNRDNQISVKVYDHEGPGGIIRGHNIGIYQSDKYFSYVNINLAGNWKFKSGHRKNWADPNYDDSFWNEISVPGNWETQGYEGYDGFGWYRKTIELDMKNPQHLVLVAGKIDDFDRVYVNGSLIGKSMSDNQEKNPIQQHRQWEYLRYYYIPKNTINWNGKNTIAICVYDGIGGGGIVHGPVELITREEYQMRKENNYYSLDGMFNKNFENFFKSIFNY